MEENAKVTNQEEKSAPKLVEEEPVVTYHEMKVGRKTLKYTATTGILPIKNHETGEIEATVFFIAYRKEGEEGRPLMFSFNGGPGSSRARTTRRGRSRPPCSSSPTARRAKRGGR